MFANLSSAIHSWAMHSSTSGEFEYFFNQERFFTVPYRVELFKEFVTPKDNTDAPRKFTDCAKLYSECKAPNEQPIGVVKKKQLKRKYQTVTPSKVDETTLEADLVTQYVQQQRQA